MFFIFLNYSYFVVKLDLGFHFYMGNLVTSYPFTTLTFLLNLEIEIASEI